MSDTRDPDGMTRRQAMVAGIAGAASLAASCTRDNTGAREERVMTKPGRMPVIFLPHGGGPWPFVDVGIGSPAELSALATYLRSLKAVPPSPPKALLVVSAHWEEPVPTVMTSPRPPMLYDYAGFPPESYQLSWPAPGDPALAGRVRALLAAAGLSSAENGERGFDHGTFVPLKLTYPDADIPTVQLSLKRGLDAAEHLALGRAIAPLRDEAVLIVGSGMTFHNLRAFGPPGRGAAETFDAWLRESVVLDAAARDARLSSWDQAPAARAAHPREEHLLPLMVIAGAAGSDRAEVSWRGTILGLQLSAYHFG